MHPDLRVGRCVRRSRLRISYRRRQILAPSTLYRPLRYTISCITSSFHCGNSICAAPMLCLAALRTKRISLRAGGYGSERHDPQRGLGVCAAGNDPWQEAGRLAGLPKPEATESLARIIASMPTSVWPLQAARTIATRLIALLPTQAGNLGQTKVVPRPEAVSV